MADVTLTEITGATSGLELAPDTSYISNLAGSATAGASTYAQTGNIDGTNGLVTAISLTGRYIISAISITNATTQNYTFKLTVDGVVIWNSSNTFETDSNIFGNIATTISSNSNSDSFICNSSLLLETSSTTDTSYRINYIARPIL